MNRYDCIVAGGGPAGCAAAYDLAAAGLRVLILDKKAFPRFKPCAGALTIKATRLLRYPIDPVVKQVISEKVVGCGKFRDIRMQGNAPICVTTIRTELDQFCLGQTMDQGAHFEIIKGIKAIHEENNGVTLTDTDGITYHTRYLIGADGVHSQVRKRIGEDKPDNSAFAIEGTVPLKKCKSNPAMTFDYGAVKNGYGWLIPKDDHINVGLYAEERVKHQISKATLQEYVKKRLGSAEIDHIVGFPIGIGGEAYMPKHSRIFLVGDAAGFADPLWGEGIHNAIKSGQGAAHAIISAIRTNADAKKEYCAAIAEIKEDIQNCRKIAQVFYKSFSISYFLLRSRTIQNAILKGFATGMTVTEIKEAFFRRKQHGFGIRKGFLASFIK